MGRVGWTLPQREQKCSLTASACEHDQHSASPSITFTALFSGSVAISKPETLDPKTRSPRSRGDTERTLARLRDSVPPWWKSTRKTCAAAAGLRCVRVLEDELPLQERLL